MYVYGVDVCCGYWVDMLFGLFVVVCVGIGVVVLLCYLVDDECDLVWLGGWIDELVIDLWLLIYLDLCDIVWICVFLLFVVMLIEVLYVWFVGDVYC